MAFYCDSALADQLSSELELLKSVVGGYFHQDGYCSEDEVLSDAEVFRLAHELLDEGERRQLIAELSALLSKDDAAVVSFWNAHAGCHNYNLEDAGDAREFLAKFLQCVAEHK